jgi:hypothetical protein
LKRLLYILALAAALSLSGCAGGTPGAERAGAPEGTPTVFPETAEAEERTEPSAPAHQTAAGIPALEREETESGTEAPSGEPEGVIYEEEPAEEEPAGSAEPEPETPEDPLQDVPGPEPEAAPEEDAAPEPDPEAPGPEEGPAVPEPSPEEPAAEEPEPSEEPAEPEFDIGYWVSRAAEMAVGKGLALDASATACWDNPITANARCVYLERDLESRLGRYAGDGEITAVWIWYEDLGDGAYLIYVGYA